MFSPAQITERLCRRYPERIVTIDSHTQGEPTRLILNYADQLTGETMHAKRLDFEARFDRTRLLLTREPRGHRDMFAAALTTPVSPGADFGLVYLDAQRYPYLCGHATIGAVTTLIETGALEAPDGSITITVDTPSGPVLAEAEVERGRVSSVSIEMVPSFVYQTGNQINVEGFGPVTLDLVCVGGFFAMVSADSLGITLETDNSDRLTRLGMAIIEAANAQLQVRHPARPEVTTVDVTEFYSESPRPGEGIGTVIYGKSHLDRSPCGTGTAAKLTLLHHLGKLNPGEEYRNGCLLGTHFTGRINSTTSIGELPGVVVRVSGSAQLTGLHEFFVDNRDPFPQGFLL